MGTVFAILWSLVNVGSPSEEVRTIIEENTILKPEIAYKIIAIESSFVESAKSNKGAIGLMQVTPIALDEIQRVVLSWTVSGRVLTDREQEFIDLCLGTIQYNHPDLKKSNTNVYVGSCFFDYLLLIYEEDTWAALAHYNGGSRAVNALRRQKPWPATRNYLQRYFWFSVYTNTI